ncbi:MAG TPA: hypothetical protein VHV08_15805 [Pirellulales bacterium]|jgi:cobyrinic acid a,c-diamide synthase|nr:hypothetical protein [Pirellulales bacterium]
MSRLPRIAVGTIQPAVAGTTMLWALMDALEREGLRIQNFLSRACFCGPNAALAITGQPPRHLDSWLMSAEQCRASFVRGCASCDLAIVEGQYGPTRARGSQLGGDLETLCDWLHLPRLAIVDAASLAGCHLPERPRSLDGVLLDRVADRGRFLELKTLLESLWNVPVLGHLAAIEGLRQLVESASVGEQPSLGLCHALGSQFVRNAELASIRRLANRCRFPSRAAPDDCPPQANCAVRVAVAFDEAFGFCFPDALELLEQKGAVLCDFSPLRDERLPPRCDVVYIGCGFPELFSEPLANNHCMLLALKSHACSGRRIYAEGGGLAYLCDHITLADGREVPMAGVFRGAAHFNPAAGAPRPTELTWTRNTWFGPSPLSWRGYLNERWTIAPADELKRCAKEAGHEADLVSTQQAIGSRLLVDFAARDELLDTFVQPFSTGGAR